MELSLLIDKIRRDKGLDLSGWRQSTLERRIERRMLFAGTGSLKDYIQMIDKDYRLYWRLISDLFIGVTDFFRDKEIWDVMRERVLPQVISSKLSAISKKKKLTTGYKPILRIWSAGCSTGEEAYSLAILLHEVLGDSISDFIIKIYGTDIMEDKLQVARKAEYDAEKVEKVEERLREKYFLNANDHESKTELPQIIRGNLIKIRENPRYKVSPNIRQLTRFRTYDLVRGEQLRGFDIIICRNVLIYFQKHLQEGVLLSFHKTLNCNGTLWLGTAESLSGGTKHLFKALHNKEKIFQKV